MKKTLEAVLTRPEEKRRMGGLFNGLDCLVELRSDDKKTGIQFRECLIDYTACQNTRCIKKLV